MTPRLRVRPLQLADRDGFHAVWGDPEVIFWGPSPSREHTSARLPLLLERTQGLLWPSGWHAVLDRASGAFLGDVLLQPAPFSPGDVEMGWHLARAAWGQGYATEAARALLDEAFLQLPVPRVVAAILPTNLRSQRVARRLGFTDRSDVLHAGLPHRLWAVRRMGDVPPRGVRSVAAT